MPKHTVNQGPLPGETYYTHRKNMLLKYKELYGDMKPKAKYKIGDHEEDYEHFPQHMWGEGLGSVVSHIRGGRYHADKREELEALGFVFKKQKVGRGNALGWDVLEACIVQYKAVNPVTTKENGWIMPKGFKVPDGDAAWPKEARGKGLGYIMNHIRHNGNYKEHRKELEALGIDFTIQEP